MYKQPILAGNFYHIYSRGNNSSDVFYDSECYETFLRLYEKYIHPIAETYAWCLMKNHFHLLVYIKDLEEINENQLSYTTVEKPKKVDQRMQFSHFLNAYTQKINWKYKRTGSLFEKSFKRKLVTDQDYFNKLIFYIHNNPVHHGIKQDMKEYPWSSYDEIIRKKSNILNINGVLNHFNSIEKFEAFHLLEEENFKNEILDFY